MARRSVIEAVWATHARAGALCRRASSLIDDVSAVCAMSIELRTSVAETRGEADMLRQMGAMWRGAWTGRADATAPIRARQTRRHRPRGVAASRSSGDHWAHARVYATRHIVGTANEGDPVATWTVREVDARRVPGARGERCLVFENHEVVRRVWKYPATWRTLSPAALLHLARKEV